MARTSVLIYVDSMTLVSCLVLNNILVNRYCLDDNLCNQSIIRGLAASSRHYQFKFYRVSVQFVELIFFFHEIAMAIIPSSSQLILLAASHKLFAGGHHRQSKPRTTTTAG